MIGDFRFYTECLGMKLLRKRDMPEDRYTNAFLGYGPEDSHFVIELTYSKLSKLFWSASFSRIWSNWNFLQLQPFMDHQQSSICTLLCPFIQLILVYLCQYSV